jgi:hypothetical protein
MCTIHRRAPWYGSREGPGVAQYMMPNFPSESVVEVPRGVLGRVLARLKLHRDMPQEQQSGWPAGQEPAGPRSRSTHLVNQHRLLIRGRGVRCPDPPTAHAGVGPEHRGYGPGPGPEGRQQGCVADAAVAARRLFGDAHGDQQHPRLLTRR